MKIGQSNSVKNEIVNKIMQSQDLLKLLHYHNSDVDIYELDNLTPKQKREMINTQIYKRKRIPANEDNDSKTYMSLEFYKSGYLADSSGYYKDCYVNIYITTTYALDDILQGSRLDEIEDVINDIFQNEHIKSLKNCKIAFSEMIPVPYPYLCKVIALRFVDTNKKALGVITNE